AGPRPRRPQPARHPGRQAAARPGRAGGPGRGLRRRAEGDRRADRQPEPGRGGRRRVRQAPARLRRPGLTVRIFAAGLRLPGVTTTLLSNLAEAVTRAVGEAGIGTYDLAGRSVSGL